MTNLTKSQEKRIAVHQGKTLDDLIQDQNIEVVRDDNALRASPKQWDGINTSVTDFWAPRWTRNAARNYALNKIKQTEHIAKVRGKRGGSILVIGAGPTLDLHYEALRNTKLPIFACNSVMKALLANGIMPKYCGVFDGKARLVGDFDGVRTPMVKYLISTAVHPDVVDAVRATGGQIRAYNKATEGVHVFDETLPAMFPIDRFTGKPTGGCVVNVNVWLALQDLGYDTVGLIGADYAFTDNRFRCNNYKPNYKLVDNELVLDGTWSKLPDNNEPMQQKECQAGPSGVPQWQEHLTYTEVLLSYMQAGGRIINCSGSAGALYRLPQMPLNVFENRTFDESWRFKR